MAGEIIEEYQPDAIWSRFVPIGLGIRKSGYEGPLLQIYATTSAMSSRGTYLNTKGLPLKRRALLLGLMPLDYFASKKVELELYRKSIGITFSEMLRQKVVASLPSETATVHVTPPGVDANFFSPTNGARSIDAIVRTSRIDTERPIVLYVGRLASDKNIPLLIEAVSKARRKPSLVLVGSGSERASLEAYAKKLGISSCTHFVGPQSEMLPSFYCMSRVCVLPTTIETFGHVFLEAMACGTPVIGFKPDGSKVMTATPEIVRDNVTGKVVKTATSEALARALDEIISVGPCDYAVMRKECRAEVLKRFSWKTFVEQMIKYQHNHLPSDTRIDGPRGGRNE